MVQRRLWIFSVLAAVLVLPSHSQILNQNLVQNPGAESGPAAQNFTDAQVTSIPGWQTMGGFSVGVYGGGDFLSSEDSYYSGQPRAEFLLRRPRKSAFDGGADDRLERRRDGYRCRAGEVLFVGLSRFPGRFLRHDLPDQFESRVSGRFRQGAADFDCSGTGERGYQCPGGAAAAHRAGVPAGQRPQGENHDRSVYRQFGTQRLCG